MSWWANTSLSKDLMTTDLRATGLLLFRPGGLMEGFLGTRMIVERLKQ